MMEYRKLPKGEERLSTLGLGLGGIQKSKPEEIEAVIKEAMAAGINFFDLCAGGASVYAPFGIRRGTEKRSRFFAGNLRNESYKKLHSSRRVCGNVRVGISCRGSREYSRQHRLQLILFRQQG